MDLGDHSELGNCSLDALHCILSSLYSLLDWKDGGSGPEIANHAVLEFSRRLQPSGSRMGVESGGEEDHLPKKGPHSLVSMWRRVLRLLRLQPGGGTLEESRNQTATDRDDPVEPCSGGDRADPD